MGLILNVCLRWFSKKSQWLQFVNHVVGRPRLEKKKEKKPHKKPCCLSHLAAAASSTVDSRMIRSQFEEGSVGFLFVMQSDILRLLWRAEFCLHPPRDEKHNAKRVRFKGSAIHWAKPKRAAKAMTQLYAFKVPWSRFKSASFFPVHVLFFLLTTLSILSPSVIWKH